MSYTQYSFLLLLLLFVPDTQYYFVAVAYIFYAGLNIPFVVCAVSVIVLKAFSLFCRLAQRIVRGDVPEPLMN